VRVAGGGAGGIAPVLPWQPSLTHLPDVCDAALRSCQPAKRRIHAIVPCHKHVLQVLVALLALIGAVLAFVTLSGRGTRICDARMISTPSSAWIIVTHLSSNTRVGSQP
jgi:hypothetical protein